MTTTMVDDVLWSSAILTSNFVINMTLLNNIFSNVIRGFDLFKKFLTFYALSLPISSQSIQKNSLRKVPAPFQ